MSNTEIPTRERIEEAINSSLKMLYTQDRDLLNQRGLEVTINAKLACYIQSHLPEWNVDVEYRREGDNPKCNSEGKEVQPDIIIHQRGPEGPNICAIEAKGHWNDEGRAIDKGKLADYKSAQGYTTAYFIEYGSKKASLQAI